VTVEDWVIILLVTLGYLAASLTLGVVAGFRRKLSVVDYVAGSRTLGLFLLYFVMGATIFSSFAFLGGPGWAYSKGAASFYILAYCGLGLIPWYVFGPRAARLGRKYGYVTQADLVSDRYQSTSLSAIMAWVSLCAFIPYLTLQMKGAGYIFYTVTEGRVPMWAGALIAYGVVVVYVYASGLMGVGWTNALQGILMLILAWALGLYLPHKLYGGVQQMFAQIAAASPDHLTIPGSASAMSWGAFSTAIIVSVIGFTMWPHGFMKAYTARDDRVLKKTIVLYPTFAIFMVPVLFIGFAGVHFVADLQPADRILPYMVTNLGLAPVVVGLFCAGALAASMSSGDAITHAAASIMVKDFYHKVLNREASDRSLTNLMRVLVIVISGVAYYFAVVAKVQLVMLLLGAYGAVVQFFPLVLATFFWPRATKQAAIWGLVAGTLVTLAFTLPQVLAHHKPLDIQPGILGLIVNFIVFITVSKLTPPMPLEHVRRFTDA
jgi:SSS family solute:Na+ symporter